MDPTHAFPRGPLWTALCALLFTAACGAGARSTFILLPDPHGGVGQITVSRAGNHQVLDQPWHAVEVAAGDTAPSSPQPLPQAQVEAAFGAVLRAVPTQPKKYLLHFQINSTELTDASRELLPEIVAEIAQRSSTDTSVVGHTDTLGSKERNYTLSVQRAQAVAALLTAAGVAPEILEITSHGEENPLIPTADGVDEPQNRRVEITVR